MCSSIVAKCLIPFTLHQTKYKIAPTLAQVHTQFTHTRFVKAMTIFPCINSMALVVDAVATLSTLRSLQLLLCMRCCYISADLQMYLNARVHTFCDPFLFRRNDSGHQLFFFSWLPLFANRNRRANCKCANPKMMQRKTSARKILEWREFSKHCSDCSRTKTKWKQALAANEKRERIKHALTRAISREWHLMLWTTELTEKEISEFIICVIVCRTLKMAMNLL